MLIGQAPGAIEAERRLPFQGRSGRVLMQWLVRAGFGSEVEARRRIYMTSITKCFPGKGAAGGDRRPSRAEVELCRPDLDRQLALITPALLILVGGLAHERFLPGRPLADLVGRVFDQSGREVASRTRASPLQRLEQTLRHPKKLIYIAMSNRNVYWRMHVSKVVLDEGYVPINPFMLFDYYLLHTVPKQLVREAINNLLSRCDEVWVFGTMSLGVKVQVGIARRLKKPLRFYDIADLPEQVYRISEKLAQEEGRD